MKNLAPTARDLYYFYETNTGLCHFQVEATPGGRFPVEQAAGLLAMYCMVLGQSPKDYLVVVSAENEALKGLTEKAEKILQAGHSVCRRVTLTRREEEVLAGILRSLCNKEIAASLNLSERTIKFHVSSLLSKFQVRGRMELARKACGHIAGSMPKCLPVPARETRPCVQIPDGYNSPALSAAVVSRDKRHLIGEGSTLSIASRDVTPAPTNFLSKAM